MTLSWVERAGPVALRVDALEDTAALASRLSVLPEATLPLAARVDRFQPMAGVWAQAGASLIFTPRFPFVAGVTYAVLLDSGRIGSLRRPAPPHHPTTVVTAVCPAAPVVPLNLLRLYVHFSAPMREGCALRYVRVTRASDGAAIEGVFLDMNPELWDPSRSRLTLLLDPGRIKRGLAPHTEAGYPLVEGEDVVVTIAAAWPDAAGQPLRAGWSRRYRVGPPLRTHVRPERWRIGVPAAGTRDPIVVAFERPLDQALLASCLGVVRELDSAPAGADGAGGPGHDARVTGTVQVDDDGGAWRFTPEVPWMAGAYVVRVDGRLEDLAGNSLVRVFDRDLGRTEDNPVESAGADLAVVVGRSAVTQAAPVVRLRLS